MFYVGFDEHITARWHIVVNSWPLKKFCSPADMSARNDVQVLYQAWKSGVTRFEKLDDAAFAEWERVRFQAALDTTLRPDEEDKDVETVEDEGRRVDDEAHTGVREGSFAAPRAADGLGGDALEYPIPTPQNESPFTFTFQNTNAPASALPFTFSFDRSPSEASPLPTPPSSSGQQPSVQVQKRPAASAAATGSSKRTRTENRTSSTVEDHASVPTTSVVVAGRTKTGRKVRADKGVLRGPRKR